MTQHIEEARKIADGWAYSGWEIGCAEVIAAARAALKEMGE